MISCSHVIFHILKSFLDFVRITFYWENIYKYIYIFYLFNLLFSFTLPNYKQTGLLNKSSLIAGQRVANLSSCQVPIGTDPTLVPLTSAKHDGTVWALGCNLPPARVKTWEFEYTVEAIALRYTYKDYPPPPLTSDRLPPEPLMDGWHYFYHCNIISPRGLCLCGV